MDEAFSMLTEYLSNFVDVDDNFQDYDDLLGAVLTNHQPH